MTYTAIYEIYGDGNFLRECEDVFQAADDDEAARLATESEDDQTEDAKSYYEDDENPFDDVHAKLTTLYDEDGKDVEF